jgi:hypothetical protein
MGSAHAPTAEKADRRAGREITPGMTCAIRGETEAAGGATEAAAALGGPVFTQERTAHHSASCMASAAPPCRGDCAGASLVAPSHPAAAASRQVVTLGALAVRPSGKRVPTIVVGSTTTNISEKAVGFDHFYRYRDKQKCAGR